MVGTSVVAWAKTLSSTLQKTKDIKYPDLRGMGASRTLLSNFKKSQAGQSGMFLLCLCMTGWCLLEK